ncbi:hypothetical protein [Bradyrhizobium macuxiense]|uniref:hypothetical protein n=1 Tax=Bradyrhizobium macuxiense TaxID=1755647 RepID=UPI0011BDA37B|nr:hypothetical protein [Bradyrhizobium macuxiense]
MSDSSDPGEPSNADEVRTFFAIYGSFLQLWQTFELVIEVAIMRRLNLSARHASIVLNSLNFAAKSNILSSLLKEEGDQEALSALGNAQTKAGRNDFIHSFLTIQDAGIFRLVRRNIKNGNYTADLNELDVPAMFTHGAQFAEAYERAQTALGVTSEDVDQYIEAIESHA